LAETLKEDAPVSGFQIVALLALACLNMQDGFDILAISYAATSIAEDWQISRSELGFVLSASLFGMMFGALTLSPVADRIGRKTITIFGLVLSGVGMIIAASAQSLEMLMIGRVLTGFGVGGILASLNTLVAEFAGEKFRGAAIAIFQLGFPLGAFLSGFAVSWLLDIGTWRHVFAFGAFTSFVFIPVMMALPESMDFLAQSGRSDALEKINKTRARLKMPLLEELPEQRVVEGDKTLSGVVELFNRTYIIRTLLIWVSFFLLLTTLYFLLSWVPRILVEMGFSEADGNRAGRLINLVGMPGIAIIGLTSTMIRPSLITTFYLVILASLLSALSLQGDSLSAVILIIAAIGFVLHGSMIGLYATAPALYPPHIRATGMGWAIGLSRLGAVMGPAMAGILLDAGWSAQQLFQFFALPAITASGAVFLLWREEKKHSASVAI